MQAPKIQNKTKPPHLASIDNSGQLTRLLSNSSPKPLPALGSLKHNRRLTSEIGASAPMPWSRPAAATFLVLVIDNLYFGVYANQPNLRHTRNFSVYS